MGANHNKIAGFALFVLVVSNVPKILKWEQITTNTGETKAFIGCFQCSKDTKMGANHNYIKDNHHIIKLFPMFQRY